MLSRNKIVIAALAAMGFGLVGFPQPAQAGSLVVDHNSVDLFNQLNLTVNEPFVSQAANTRLIFLDRSVGDNINQSLDCLAVSTWGLSDNSCRKDYTNLQTYQPKLFNQSDLNAGSVPAEIVFSPHARFNRQNWDYAMGSNSTWQDIVRDFVTNQFPLYHSEGYDIVSFQFNYQTVQGTALLSIVDPTNGFFARTYATNPGADGVWNIEDLEALEAAHPEKKFIYWTTSLSRREGTQESTEFNDQLRQYAAATGKILFDVADIESHDPSGMLCIDNKDGVVYQQLDESGNVIKSENNPNDGFAYPAICQRYTPETNGGHLGVSAGRIRLAKAFWVLMTQITGWQPDLTITPTPTPLPTPTPTTIPADPTPSIEVPTPTPPVPNSTPEPTPAQQLILTSLVTDDDVTEDGSTYSRNTSWFGVGANLNSSYSAIRFGQVQIPPNAIILTASLDVQSKYEQFQSLLFDISAEASGDPAIFSNSNRPSGRGLSAAKVSKFIVGPWGANTWHSIGDVTALVQETVNRPDWQAGNHLALIAKGTSLVPFSRMTFYGAEAGVAQAPRLTVLYGFLP